MCERARKPEKIGQLQKLAKDGQHLEEVQNKNIHKNLIRFGGNLIKSDPQ